MSDRANLPEQLRALRDLARRARRLAAGVSNGDRKQLLTHAEELERQALELERGIDQAVPPPVVQEQVQVQVQLQRQHETGPPADPKEPKPKD